MKRLLARSWSSIILLLVSAWLLFPVYVMVKISLSNTAAILAEHPTLGMHTITFAHWHAVLTSGTLLAPLGKSAGTAALVVLITLAVALPGAYGMVHLRRPAQYSILGALFLIRMLPDVAIAQPIAGWYSRFGLTDTIIGLACAQTIRVIPVAVWIMLEVFRSIPKEIEEHAALDGCSRLRSLVSIVLPMSLSGISVAAIFAWLLSWDEFTYALYLSLAKPTLPLVVYYYLNRGSWFSVASYAVIITIPVIIITYALQKYIREGYTAGAVKG